MKQQDVNFEENFIHAVHIDVELNRNHGIGQAIDKNGKLISINITHHNQNRDERLMKR